MQEQPVVDQYPNLRRLVAQLEEQASEVLESVVLYGPAAHGDTYDNLKELHVLIVLSDLEIATLERVGDPVRRWTKEGYPMPRLFSRALIVDASDVFPMEFLEISAHRIVLSGSDPIADLSISRAHLRVQCERELREKMMRLREAYLETGGKERPITRLLRESYVSFAELFRGCLHLVEDAPPERNRDVAVDLCSRVGVDAAPFQEIESMLSKRAEEAESASALFARYYRSLSGVVSAIDRLHSTEETSS